MLKKPNNHLLTLVSGPWNSSLAWVNPEAVCPVATRQYTKAAAVVHHHLCLWSSLLAALMLVTVALQQPAAFISFSTVLLLARWCVACGLLLLASKLRNGLATGVTSVM